MSAILGTVVGSCVVPSDTADIYGTHDAQYGIGGRRTVTNKAAVAAIPALRRQVGMAVYVQNGETGMVYQLREGTDDANFHQVGEVIDPRPFQIPYGAGVTGMLTHSDQLSFNVGGGYGNDPELTIKGGTNYAGIVINNGYGEVGKIQTNSSGRMEIIADYQLSIDTHGHPGAFTFDHTNGHNPYFQIDSTIGGNSADAQIVFVHPTGSTVKSNIVADSSNGVTINAYASMTLNAGVTTTTGIMTISTSSGGLRIESGAGAYMRGTTSVSLAVNDAGYQFAIIEGTPIGSGNGAKLGFFGLTPVAKATISGAKGSNAALGSLLTALHNMGLVTDSTTA